MTFFSSFSPVAACRSAFPFLASRYFSVVCLGCAPKSGLKGGLKVVSGPYFTGFAGSAVQGAYQGHKKNDLTTTDRTMLPPIWQTHGYSLAHGIVGELSATPKLPEKKPFVVGHLDSSLRFYHAIPSINPGWRYLMSI